MYGQPASGLPTAKVITPAGDPSTTTAQQATNSGGGSAAWGTNNLAVFFPVYIDQPRTYVKAFWANGGTASGNVDVGIYTISGATATRVVASTAEAQGTISVIQVAAAFTSTTIGPGLYYLAMSCSSTTATALRASVSNPVLKAVGAFQAATSHPLPSTATVVTFAGTALPLFGFSENTVI